MGTGPTKSTFHTVYYSDVPGEPEIIGGAYSDFDEARINAGNGCFRIDEDVICTHSRELKSTIQHHLEDFKKAA